MFHQFGVNRKRQGFPAGGFRLGELARLVPQIGERRLQMERLRVVNLGRNAPVAQELPQDVSLWTPNYELVVNMG
jgi:hypothetical protein